MKMPRHNHKKSPSCSNSDSDSESYSRSHSRSSSSSTSSSDRSPSPKHKSDKHKEERKTPEKRKKTGYQLFCEKERKKVVRQNPNFTLGDISRELGQRWKDLTDRRRNTFNKQAEQ